MKAATLEFHGTKFKRYYITSQEDACKATHIITNSNTPRFGLDIETSKKVGWEKFEPLKKGRRIIGPCPGLCPHLSDIRLIQIYDHNEKTVYVFDCAKIGMHYWKGSGMFRIMLTEKKYVAHNGVFEIKHFTHNGFSDMQVDCSMLLDMMVNRAEHSPFEPPEEDNDDEDDFENDGLGKLKKVGFGLDACIARLFKIHIGKHFQTSDWNAGDLSSEQINYAALDAVLTYVVGKKQYKKVIDYKMKRSYEVFRDMQHVVSDMELKGVLIDRKAHKDLIEDWKVTHEENTKQIEKRFKKINVRSSKQLNKWAEEHYPKDFIDRLWPKTKKGALSFGKNSLIEVCDYIQRKYKKESKSIRTLLTYKRVDKLLSTYGETLEKIVHPITNRIHCSFIIGETRTGRLSSREPNLQNLPRDESVRRLFVAPTGKNLLVADYSQIEIRSGAALSKDSVMTNAFEKGIDLHKYILKICFGWKMKDITKDQRQMGKAINFGYMFRMGWKKFGKYALTSYGVRVKEGEAEKTFNIFHKLYNMYSRWCEVEYRKCERLGFVRTPLGMMRKLVPEEMYTRAVNTQVQGGASEALKLAMIDYRKKKIEKAPLVLNVHDELMCECSNMVHDHYRFDLEQSMIKGFQEVFPDAPINNLVEAKFGVNWNEAKK